MTCDSDGLDLEVALGVEVGVVLGVGVAVGVLVGVIVGVFVGLGVLAGTIAEPSAPGVPPGLGMVPLAGFAVGVAVAPGSGEVVFAITPQLDSTTSRASDIETKAMTFSLPITYPEGDSFRYTILFILRAHRQGCRHPLCLRENRYGKCQVCIFVLAELTRRSQYDNIQKIQKNQK